MATSVFRSSAFAASSLNREFAERWPSLVEALMRPKQHAVWVNPFARGGKLDVKTFLLDRGFRPCSGVAGQAHIWAPCSSKGAAGHARSKLALPKPPTCSKTGLKIYYPLDLASAMPALALIQALTTYKQGGRVLDVCAAPGGKFLILAGALFDLRDEVGECLVAVDLDKFRLSRLKQNLQLYLPRRVLEKVHAVLGDGTQLPSINMPDHIQGKQFDAILIDVPCSSERERLLKGGPDIQRAFINPHAVAHASADAVRANAIADVLCAPLKVQSNIRRQEALLRACMQENPQGVFVYSTCALSALENDGVITAVLRRSLSDWQTSAEDVQTSNVTTERRKHGWQILPDVDGWGPIYWSVLRRT